MQRKRSGLVRMTMQCGSMWLTVSGELLSLCCRPFCYLNLHTGSEINFELKSFSVETKPCFFSLHRFATLSPSDSRSSLASSFAAAVRNDPFPH